MFGHAHNSSDETRAFVSINPRLDRLPILSIMQDSGINQLRNVQWCRDSAAPVEDKPRYEQKSASPAGILLQERNKKTLSMIAHHRVFERNVYVYRH